MIVIRPDRVNQVAILVNPRPGPVIGARYHFDTWSPNPRLFVAGVAQVAFRPRTGRLLIASLRNHSCARSCLCSFDYDCFRERHF